MEKSILGTSKVTQIGIIVHDIQKTAQAYADFLGVDVPNFVHTDTYELTQAQYNGEPCHARAKLAFFHCGQVDIELIEPDQTQSVWRDYLKTHGEGVQHIAFGIKGMGEITKKLEENGMPLTQKGEYTGGRYAYFDTASSLKVDLELLEND